MRRYGLSILATMMLSAHALGQVIPWQQGGMVTTCTGTFTDSGGLMGSYAPGEVGVMRITPASSTELLTVTFTHFDFPSQGLPNCDLDKLRVYDGPIHSVPQSPIIGTYCDENQPVVVRSTTPGGFLVFEFRSVPSSPGGNWEATITCDPIPDDCSNAIDLVLGVTSSEFYGTPPDGSSSCSTGGSDRWYFFTAPQDGVLSLDTTGSTVGMELSTHSACPGTSANEIRCSSEAGGSAQLRQAMSSGQMILVRLGALGDSGSTDEFTLTSIFQPVSVGNDTCANAAELEEGATQSTFIGTSSDGMSDCGPVGRNRWFEFTAVDEFHRVQVDTTGTEIPASLALYADCVGGPASLLRCDDGSGGSASLQYLMCPGETVYLKVTELGNSSPEQVLQFNAALPPVGPKNDDCLNAEVLPSGFSTTPFTTRRATLDGASLLGFCELNPSDTNGQIYKDVWFEYTPDIGGCTYISTFNQIGRDTRLAVYEGTPCPGDPLFVVACSDDEVQPISFPFEAGMDVTLDAGKTYLIRIGNYSSSTPVGPGNLVISPGPLAIANDQGMQTGAPGCGSISPFTDLCNGDGGDQMGCTNCPCMNNAPAGTIGGCLNSAGTSSRLAASGNPSLALPSGSSIDLRLEATGMPPSAFGVLISGNAVAPGNMANPCFGLNSGVQFSQFDGLRCAVQATQRHGGRSANGEGVINDSSGPSRVWGGEAQPAAGLGNQAGFVAGQTRYFQINHREDAMLVCMRGLSTSQATEITFQP